MQIYKSPGGAEYLVFRGMVYFMPRDKSGARQSDMTVSRFLDLIERGFMRFSRTINPALAYRPEHWNSTNC